MHVHRLTVLPLLFGVLFAGLALRLAWLEVAIHPALSRAAVLERAERVSLRPSRGTVLDKNRMPLSDPVPSYRAVVYPAAFEAEGPGTAALAEALGATAGEMAEKIGLSRGPVEVASELSASQLAAVSRLGIGGGVAVVADELRYGPKALAAHVVGYMCGGDGAGLEGAWRTVLEGKGPEYLALFVDGRGRPIESLGWRKLDWPVEGGSAWARLPCDVVTTIDAAVQAAVETVMDRLVPQGAVVVMDPWSGDIVAMASRPDFDQNRPGAYLDRTDGCLLNRAIASYPPGSVFKPILAAAALEAGAASPDEMFSCSGGVSGNDWRILCHRDTEGGHGKLSLTWALADSCNVVFSGLGDRLGPKELAGWSARFGFGQPTGLGLPGESAGKVPAGESGAGDGGPCSVPGFYIGHGGLEATPVQLAQAYSVLARGGTRVAPRLVRAVDCPDGAGGAAGQAGPRPTGRVISRFTAAWVTAALVTAVESGTGRPAAVRRDVAGKTGTAETGRVNASGEALHDAWFAGFWPAHRARYVMVVLIEDTPEGGASAAKVFGDIVVLLEE